MRRNAVALLFCGLVVAALPGCRSAEPAADLQFDGRGWGGPELKYSVDEKSGTIQLDAGMMVQRDFRWANSEFSVEFRDSRSVVWGVRFLDSTFSKVRDEDLRRTLVKVAKIGEQRYKLGPELPPEQRCLFDRVLEFQFQLDQGGKAYKMVVGWWYEKIFDERRQAEQRLEALKVEAPLEVKVTEGAWNRLHVAVLNGKLTYAVNGAAGSGPVDLDPRLNGRLAFYVASGGPLLIRNLKLGAEPKASGP